MTFESFSKLRPAVSIPRPYALHFSCISAEIPSPLLEAEPPWEAHQKSIDKLTRVPRDHVNFYSF